MASYYDLATIALDPEFQKRINYAMVTSAVQICSEDTTTPSHTYRVAFARKVLDADYSIPHVTMAVLVNSSIAAEGSIGGQSPAYSIPDSDLQFTVNSLWNALSGV